MGVEGSREEVDQKMKERLSTLAEEIAKTNELKESLQCEVSELKNQLEIISCEVEDKNTRNEILLKELEILQKSSDDVIKEKEPISDEKQSIQKELKETFLKLENSFGEIKQLEQTILDTSQHKSELAKALSDLKISREESDNLKIKVKQIESLNVTELKEENAILNERLSQFEDEKIEIMSSFEKCREEKETLELVQLEEKKSFEKRISSLEEEVKKQGSFHLTEDTEAKIKSLAKEMERKMVTMETEHEEELE